MKYRNLIAVLIGIGIVVLTNTTSQVLATTSTKLKTRKFAEKTNLPLKKVLSVTFNQPVNSLTLDKNISVVDSKGNSVPVSFMKDIFNKNIVRISPPTEGYKEGESYTLRLNKGIATIKDNHLKYDVLMDFSIKAKKSENKPIEIDKTNRADMNTPLYKGMPNNVKDWYLDADNKSGEYAQIRHNFNKKYLSDKYADITDIDYFTRMKTNLDFSQVNNDDFVPEGCYGKYNLFFRELGTALNDVDMTKDIRLQYIWRPDIEEKLIPLLNAKRREQGLCELKPDNDLKAMAMYSAKKSKIYNLCTYGRSYSKITHEKIGFSVDRAWEKTLHEIRDNMKKNNTIKRITGYGFDSYGLPVTTKGKSYVGWAPHENLHDTIVFGDPIYTTYTEIGKKLGYDNGSKCKISCIGGCGENISTAEDIIKVWDSMEYGFAENNAEDNTGEFNKPNYKFPNPKLKKIGIAVSYSIPKTPAEGKGILDVMILLSE